MIGAIVFFAICFLTVYTIVLACSYSHAKRSTNTVLTFKRFKTLYNADPENWDIRIGCWHNEDVDGYTPCWRNHSIKFSSLFQYFLFMRWYRATKRKGMGIGDVDDAMDLVRDIQKVVEERAEKSRQEITSSYEQVMKRVEAANAALNRGFSSAFAAQLDNKEQEGEL